MWVNQSVTYVGELDPLCVLCGLCGSIIDEVSTPKFLGKTSFER